jgi:DNA transformation protein
MKRASGFVAFALDQLDDVHELIARPMFAGVGLYSGDLFFGIVYGDTLYFKVDDKTRGRYQRAGMNPFKPYANRPTTLQYYEVPPGVLEDRGRLTRWARAAIDTARRSKSRTKR